MPDVTLAEIAAHLEEVHGVRFSETAVWRQLKCHGVTFKKRPRIRANNTDQAS